MKVRKAKLNGDGLVITYEEVPQGRKKRNVILTDDTPVHKDLTQSFQNLAIHLVILTGFVSTKQVKNIETPKPELIEGVHVNGISVKSGDDPGVVISGHRIHPDSGKAVILNTPFTRLNEGDETAYKFVEDLQEKLDRAVKETSAYEDGTKLGDDPQLTMFDDNEAKERTDGENVTEGELQEMTEGDDEVWKDGKRPNV